MIDQLCKFSTFFCLLVLLPVTSHGFEHWHVSTEKELKTLVVSNRKSQAQVLWISGPIKQLPTDPDEKLEQSFIIEAFQTLEIPLLEFQKFPWVHLKTSLPGALQISAITSFEQQVNIYPGSHNRWTARSRPGSELVAMNLAPFSQKIRIFDSNSEGSENEIVLELKAFSSLRLALPNWIVGKIMTLEGEARVQGFLLSKQASQAFQLSRQASRLNVNIEKTYFRLSNPDNTQSYIVSLTDPQMIEQARKQVASPPYAQIILPRILVAEIDYGSGNENRNLSQTGAPLWSWHISRVFNFAQLAHQDCDGSPEMLEELLQLWQEGSRTICFWNYKVVEEISGKNLATPSGSVTRSPSSKHPDPAFLRP